MFSFSPIEKIAIKALPSFLNKLDDGVLVNFISGLREEFLDQCVEDETVEILITVETVDGLEIVMFNVVALDVSCYVRVIKQYTFKQLIELIKEKI